MGPQPVHLIEQLRKDLALSTHVPRCEHEVDVLQDHERRLQQARQREDRGDLLQGATGNDDASRVRQLGAYVPARERLSGPGRSMQQDSATYRHPVALQHVAPLMKVDDVAPEQAAHRFLHDDVLVVHTWLRGEEHAELGWAFHVAVLIACRWLEAERKHTVSVDRCFVSAAHDRPHRRLGLRGVRTSHLEGRSFSWIARLLVHPDHHRLIAVGANPEGVDREEDLFVEAGWPGDSRRYADVALCPGRSGAVQDAGQRLNPMVGLNNGGDPDGPAVLLRGPIDVHESEEWELFGVDAEVAERPAKLG